MWEKALHQWASAKARQFTLCAGAAEDAHTMYGISDVQLAVSEKPQLLEDTIGAPRLCKDKESAKNFKYTF